MCQQPRMQVWLGPTVLGSKPSGSHCTYLHHLASHCTNHVLQTLQHSHPIAIVQEMGGYWDHLQDKREGEDQEHLVSRRAGNGCRQGLTHTALWCQDFLPFHSSGNRDGGSPPTSHWLFLFSSGVAQGAQMPALPFFWPVHTPHENISKTRLGQANSPSSPTAAEMDVIQREHQT